MKIFFVIPAYNEEKSIASVVKELKKHYKNIIVVDDGSKDKTFSAAKKAGATVLKHFINRGQGAALQTAIEAALDYGADIIVTFDADGQHRISDVKKMIPLVKSGKFDVVLGSRFLKGAGEIPFSRRFLLKGSVIFQRVVWGVPLSDAHNGLRVFSRKAARKIQITSDRMEHASQIAEEIMKYNLRYKEVPVTIRYTDYALQKGHGSFGQALKVLSHFIIRKLLR